MQMPPARKGRLHLLLIETIDKNDDMKILLLLLATMFTFFAALQYNDPDPWRWAAMYAYMAGVCGFAAFGKKSFPLLLAGVAVCLVWLAVWMPEFIGWIQAGTPNIAGAMKSETPSIEYAREFFGLLICAGVLIWQASSLKKKRTKQNL